MLKIDLDNLNTFGLPLEEILLIKLSNRGLSNKFEEDIEEILKSLIINLTSRKILTKGEVFRIDSRGGIMYFRILDFVPNTDAIRIDFRTEITISYENFKF